MARSSAAVKRPPAPKALLPKASPSMVSSPSPASAMVASPKALSPKPSLPEASAPAGDLAKRAPRGARATPPRPASVDLSLPIDAEGAGEGPAWGWVRRTIAIGTNADPCQPIEREHLIMRRILEVLDRFGHPVGIVTKSALVLRDLDILSAMAKRNLVKVALSVTTLDPKLARVMEPRAATPPLRLDALRQLTAAGVPTAGLVG